jgi:hypothetical protein
MPCPTLASGFIQPDLVQTPAGVRLDIVHDPLGASLGFDNQVNVVGTHMGGQQRPALLSAPFPQCGQYHLSTGSIHAIRRLVHLLTFRHYPLRMGFEQAAPWQIVRSIHRTRCVAVQVASVTSKCNQIDHTSVSGQAPTAPYGRGSAWPPAPASSKRKARIELNAAVVRRPSPASAHSASSEARIHGGGVQELR